MQLATFYWGALGGAPAAPRNLTATAASSSQINLSWTASTGAASYNVLGSTTSGGPYTSIATGVTTTSYSNTGLTASTAYYYVVQAVNSAGTSANSAQASATTLPPAPAAPRNLTATAASSSQINLSWTASTGAASYNVLGSTTSGGPYSTVADGVTTTSYSNTGLTASATYYYVVQAVNTSGASAYSAQTSATTQAAPAAPTAPTNLTATAASSSQINLSWTASTGAASYNVLNSTTSGGPYSTVANGVTTNSYSNTGLAASATYYYVVQAVNSAGASAYSAEASATTQSGSAPPVGFVQLNTNDNTSLPPASASKVAVAYPSAQTAADLNIVVVGFDDTVATISSVTDSSGNVYNLAVGPTVFGPTKNSPSVTQAIYYAVNIAAAAAGANTVTVVFNGSATWPDVRVAEYSGFNTLDVTAAAGGTVAANNSGSVTTTVANELLFASNYTI